MTKYVLAALLSLALTLLNWFAWLGWDQQRDVHPDGHSTGPYEPWQVIGLILVLAVMGGIAVWRRQAAAAVVGATVGMTVAAAVDWSDDGDGLWVIGAGLVGIGTLLVGGITLGLASIVRREVEGTGQSTGAQG
ncbi:hypothetical protein [Actinomadura sp. 9N407]|uniref:hypothetical protein n=1 Tax=Actinomadura sp. 9N407 TaxID=3375154 RepID=UPI0037A2AB62